MSEHIREQARRTSAAYQQGEQACLDGEHRDDNPHQYGQLRAFWFKGFDDAQVVRDEWEQGNHDRARMWAPA